MKNNVIIYLCDDEINFIDIISDKLNSVCISELRKCEVRSFSDGRELIKAFGHRAADVVFLDIDMPDMTGFETAKRLQEINKKVNIIFVTSHEDKVFQSYEYHPFWFVRKSHLEDLQIVLSRLFTKIDSEYEDSRPPFKLTAGNRTIEIDVKNVIYIQAYKHYILIKSSNNTEIQMRCKISDAQQQLSQFHFVRIQNSIIVNCRFISHITRRSVILQNSEELSISRDKIDYVKAEYQKFIRSR